MCYTGKCRFESKLIDNGGGDCMVCCHQRFYKKYGEHACIVGGYIDDEETEKYIAKHADRLDRIYMQWLEDWAYRRYEARQ